MVVMVRAPKGCRLYVSRLCTAAKPRAVYVARGRVDKKAHACAPHRSIVLLRQGLFKALELDSIAFDPAADRTHSSVQRTSKGSETVLDLGRCLMMNAAHDEPATFQRSQRLREHPLRHSGHAAPQFRVSLRTPLKKNEKRDRPFVREQLDDSPRAGNAEQRLHREELITARRDPHSMAARTVVPSKSLSASSAASGRRLSS